MYRTGFTSVTFRKLSCEEICKIAKENDIEYIEWGGDVHLPPEDSHALENILLLQEKYNIKALSYGSYYRAGQNDTALFSRMLDICESINARRIRIWLGKTGSKKTSSQILAEYVSEVQTLCDMAKKKNITVACEFHENTYNDTGESSAEFIKKVNRDNFRTYWQPLRNKNDYNSLVQTAAFVDGVHVFNWGKTGIRHSLEKNRDGWKKYIDYLKKNSDNTDFIIEFVKSDSPEQFRKDIITLKSIIQNT